MNEQDTVEWYEAMKAKVAAAKAEASKPRPPTFRCVEGLQKWEAKYKHKK